MTIEEFQKNGELVSQWRDVLSMPIFKIVLGVLKDDEPVRRAIRTDISPTFAHVRLGHQSGWAEYEQTLTEVLLNPPKSRDHIEPTFEAETEPES